MQYIFAVTFGTLISLKSWTGHNRIDRIGKRSPSRQISGWNKLKMAPERPISENSGIIWINDIDRRSGNQVQTVFVSPNQTAMIT